MGLFSRLGKSGTAAATPASAEQQLQQQQRQRELAREAARKIDEIEAAMAADIFPSASASTAATPAVAPAPAAVASTAPADDELPHAAATPESAALADEITILYAHGQFDVAAELLASRLAECEQPELWWLLFDLYQLLERRDAFDTLSLAYAQRFETSPPDWHARAPASTPAARLTLATQQFDSHTAQADLLSTLQASPPELRLTGAEALVDALRATLVTGERDSTAIPWLLLLELLQRLNREAEFEQIALDYCATFEVSPPSFRAQPDAIGTGQPASRAAALANVDAFELPAAMHAPLASLQTRIIAYAAQHPRLIFDGSRLRQLDYICAQQLLACLSSLPVSYIEFRNVNHLVASLLRLQGYATLAQIVPRPY
ncbi:hypothetical protein [Duganella fentianensis]|uniref:hypothetical protein n=1 Tax=Duganella fentianensis TaxID=2692177 RepID=UPI0032B25363